MIFMPESNRPIWDIYYTTVYNCNCNCRAVAWVSPSLRTHWTLSQTSSLPFVVVNVPYDHTFYSGSKVNVPVNGIFVSFYSVVDGGAHTGRYGVGVCGVRVLVGMELRPVVQVNRLHGPCRVRVPVHRRRNPYSVHSIMGKVFILSQRQGNMKTNFVLIFPTLRNNKIGLCVGYHKNRGVWDCFFKVQVYVGLWNCATFKIQVASWMIINSLNSLLIVY